MDDGGVQMVQPMQADMERHKEHFQHPVSEDNDGLGTVEGVSAEGRRHG
jgi:hypothetical protein